MRYACLHNSLPSADHCINYTSVGSQIWGHCSPSYTGMNVGLTHQPCPWYYPPLCYDLLSLLQMVHCTTQLEPRGVQTLASAHVLHLPHTLVQVFQVCSGDSEGSGSVGSSLEWECHPEREWSIEVKYKARSLEWQGFSRSPEQRGFIGKSRWGPSSQWQKSESVTGIKVDIWTWTYHTETRVLYMSQWA